MVNAIPAWIVSGLDYATGIIPAIGLAMIARRLMNKKVACFLFLGFILAAFFNQTIISITCVACVLVAILMLNQNNTVKAEVMDDGNEF